MHGSELVAQPNDLLVESGLGFLEMHDALVEAFKLLTDVRLHPGSRGQELGEVRALLRIASTCSRIGRTSSSRSATVERDDDALGQSERRELQECAIGRAEH